MYIKVYILHIYVWYKFIFIVFALYHVGHNALSIFICLYYVSKQREGNAGSFLQRKSVLK